MIIDIRFHFTFLTLLITGFLMQPGQLSAQSVDENYDQADLREMVGQMLMVSFNPNSEYADTLHTDITQRNLGGVLLFAFHVENPSGLNQLTAELHQKADTPLFMAIDQEGGEVARLNGNNGFEDTYTAEELGDMDSEQTTRNQAAMMADWLDEGGINVNLAPVVDVNINPDSPVIGGMERSFLMTRKQLPGMQAGLLMNLNNAILSPL